MKTISDRLIHLLEKFDLTQTELAERAGVSQPTIWKIVNGRSKKSRELPAIAQALGVNLAWLATGIGPVQGDDDAKLQPLDQSKIIPVYDVNGKTEAIITSPVTKSAASWRAYVMDRDGMVNVAPAGAIVIVDSELAAGMNDYVIAVRNGKISVWRFKEGAEPETCILQSDDSAVPPVSAPLSSVIGPVLFIVNEFRRL